MRTIVGFALLAACLSGPAAAQVPLNAEKAKALSLAPEDQHRLFPIMETVFRVNTVKRGDKVHPLPVAAKQISADYSYDYQGKTWTVDEYMKAYNVSGVLVLKDGQIVFERYGLDRKPTDRWTSFSVAKSVTSTLVGAAIRDGKMALADPITKYVPEMKGSAYDGVTLRQLLTMSSGVKWDEHYADPKSDIVQIGAILDPGVNPIVSYLRRLPREREAGTLFHYNTAETVLVGIAVGRAVGKPISAYLSEKIWAPYGMEQDAVWMVDRGGQERGGCCLSMTLRDYGRFGQFILDGGIADGQAVLPADWIGEATRRQIANDRPAPFGYGYFWWIGPEAYEASGIYGQSILTYPKDRIVIVINSAWPRADGDDLFGPMSAFHRALRAAANE